MSWENRTSGVSGTLKGITYGNGKFVTVGYSGHILTSSDNGTSWDKRTSRTNHHLNRVAFGNNTFVAGSWLSPYGTIIASSDNGTS